MDEREPTRRSTLGLLAVATTIGSTGLAAGGTAGPLLAEHLSGRATAGLPLGFLVAGSAVAALAISRGSSRVGRARALALGYATGAVGAGVTIVGGTIGGLAIVLGGCLLLGAANASIFLTRYAAAEVGGPESRGRAIGFAFFATALGAVISPNLLAPGGAVARASGLPELTGMFVLAVPAFGIAGLVIAGLVHPRAPHLGRGAVFPRRAAERRVPPVEVVAGLGAIPARVAVLVLCTTNLIMVAIMAVAPLHLVGHGHGLGFVGFVVSLHVAGMFGPSPVTGWLADRVGPTAVATSGTAALLVAGVASAFLDLDRTWAMVGFLVFVGVAWNAGVVGASAMLVASVPSDIRPRSEGIGETAMGLAAAVGAPGAGLVFSRGGFAALGMIGAAAAATALGAMGLAARTASAPGTEPGRRPPSRVGPA